MTLKHYFTSPKWIISSIVLAVSAPFLWNCMYYNADSGRFWLLDPNITNQRALLPFSYTTEYYYGWESSDTTYIAENIQSWQQMTGKEVKEADIHSIIYGTAPGAYFDKKYNRQNTLMRFLNKPANAPLLRYLNFAKKCEDLFNNSEVWDSKQSVDYLINAAIKTGEKLALEQVTNPELSRRINYLLIKLYKSAGKMQKARTLFEQQFKDKNGKDWIDAAAIYQYATLQKDSVLENIWYARAWDAGFYNRIWLYQAYRQKGLELSLKSPVATNRDKATMVAMLAAREPGRSLKSLQRAYQFDPTLPDLSKLLAREVNKLENWLLSPKLHGQPLRIEIPYQENDNGPDNAALLKADLEHLAACRTFVAKVIAEQKRTDPGFWLLSAAHLAFLDQDFNGTQKLVKQGLVIADLPVNQRVQLQLVGLLAETSASGQISTATENKIPGIYQAIHDNSMAFDNPDGLRQKLSLLLSNLFIQHNQLAKGAFLLGNTSDYYEGSGYPNAQVLFNKLLEDGTPADFDKAIAMVTNPKTDFERWMAGEPHRYNAELEWDETTNNVKPAAGQPTGWEVEKLREFKAMYFTRNDQLDSALAALKPVPDTYWKRTGMITDYDYTYFRTNPFASGIAVNGVTLSQKDTLSQFNKRTFLEKLIALKKETSAAKLQENAYLIGNAYFNMTYHNRDWWLMMTPEKSSGEMDFVSDNSVPLTEFQKAYYECKLAQEFYKKAMKLNPNNDLGVAATYMAGLCERNRQLYEFARNRKEWSDEFVAGPNAYFDQVKGKPFQSAISCSWFQYRLK